MERQAGVEPATSRFADEVTAIFTTDRVRAPGNRRGLNALAGRRRPPLSYGLPVRKESNLRPCSHEVTALFTTGMGDTIREQAIAETPVRRSP